MSRTVGATQKTSDHLKRNPNNGKIPNGLWDFFFNARATIAHCISKIAHAHYYGIVSNTTFVRHTVQYRRRWFEDKLLFMFLDSDSLEVHLLKLDSLDSRTVCKLQRKPSSTWFHFLPAL